MNPARYQELLGQLLDGELPEGTSQELADALRATPELRRDLQQHLVLWELWSQHQAPERSATAFLHAWKTRLRAEGENPATFEEKLKARLEAPPSPDRTSPVHAFIRFVWKAVCRPTGAACVGTMVLVGLLLLWFGGIGRAHAITLHGDAVCTACTLHEGPDHLPAIRVNDASSNRVYYLDVNSSVRELQTRFCSGPTPATAKGTTRSESGKLRFNATQVVLPDAPPPANSKRQEKVIFPI